MATASACASSGARTVPLTRRGGGRAGGAAGRILTSSRQAHAQDEDLPEEVDRRLTEIEAALAAFDERPVTLRPGGDRARRRLRQHRRARAGCGSSAATSGPRTSCRSRRSPSRRPTRGTPDGTAPAAADLRPTSSRIAQRAGRRRHAGRTDGAAGDAPVQAGPDAAAEPEEEDGIKPLPDRLLTELTAHRTLALRHALGERPDVAFLAALHALCLKLFYPYALDTCLELDLQERRVHRAGAGAERQRPAKADRDRHQVWAGGAAARGRRICGTRWRRLDDDTRQSLFAHCVGAAVNAVHEAWNRRPKALAHADLLARRCSSTWPRPGWTPTVDTYLGRVTKARILQAVREAKGEEAAERIAHLKKGEMAEQAEELLAGSGWLPEPLRTPGQVSTAAAAIAGADAEADGRTERPPMDERPMEADWGTRSRTRPRAGGLPRISSLFRSHRRFGGPPATAGLSFFGGHHAGQHCPTWRAAWPRTPRRSAATISPTAAAKAATGSSATSTTRPGAASMCG